MRRSQIFTFAVFFLALALPILASPLPPLTDYVNHLARVFIVGQLAKDPVLAQFYGVDWHLLPNLAMDLLVPPLAQLIGIYWAGKVFILLAFALVLSGTLAISAAFNGKIEPAAYIAAPVIFASVTILGLLNYLFGIGLALWGIALWIRLANAKWYVRGLVSLGFVAATYLGHLAASGVYGLGIAAYELAKVSEERSFNFRDALARAAIVIVPFLPIAAQTVLGASDGGDIVWTLAQKGEGVRFLARSYWWSAERAVAGLALLGLGLAYWAGWWRFTRAALWFIAISVPVYLALPYEMIGTWAVDIRVPTGLFFVLVGMLRWQLPNPRAQAVMVAAALVLTLARMAGILIADQDFDRTTRDVQASLGAIPQGARIMIARTDPPGDMPLSVQYVPCLAVIERHSLVSVVFSDPKAQILVVKPPHRAYAGGYDDDPVPFSEMLNPPATSEAAPSGRIYWTNWKQDYDFLYVLGSESAALPIPPALTLVASGHKMRLYRINHDSSKISTEP